MISISIIIPYFKSLHYIKNCLQGLNVNSDYPINEVIVVNDGSPDLEELKTFLNQEVTHFSFPLRLLERKENKGFAYTCNEGARVAKSQYLLFLNADIVPTGGWLSPLVRFLESHPQVGVLGSRLLFPNIHTIQHVGGTFDNDYKPLHVYKGQPAFLPFLNRNRKVQWVTGACLLIKKSDFDAVSCFDETYISSSEDTDLCFKIRFNLNKEVWVIAQSILYHHTDVTGVTSQNIERTHRLFFERWNTHIICDEDEIYISDGFAPRFLHILRQLIHTSDLGTITFIIQELQIPNLQQQEQYVDTMGIEGLKNSLERIQSQFPSYRFLPYPNKISSPQENLPPSSFQSFVIRQITTLLSSSNLSTRDRDTMLFALNQSLGSMQFFTILYNLASMLSASQDVTNAGYLFSFLARYLEKMDNSLAGKALFKLSEIQIEKEKKIELLTQCLQIYPQHKRAAEELGSLTGKEA